MNFYRISLYGLFFALAIRSEAQDFKWQKEVPGHFYPYKPPTIPGFSINSVFDLVNRIPVIAHPRGFDVQERCHVTKGDPYSAQLHINFYDYYSYQNGPVKRSEAHVPTITISINDPEALMDDQTTLFSEYSGALHQPEMFTDTFAVSPKTMNGCRAGSGINNQFGRPVRFWVLNPKGIRFFRPVTREEYIRVYIAKLEDDIEKDSEGLAESKKTLEEMGKNAAFKNSLTEFENIQKAMVKWVEFEKSKKQHYEKKLAAMTEGERKAPARYAMYKNPAVMKDKDGNYLEHISGHLLYEPLEDMKDTLATVPLFTFYEKGFDPKLPETSFQLIVVFDAFEVETDREMKHFFDRELYPFFPFKELAGMMY